MEQNKAVAERKRVETPSGRISYMEQGRGPVALFVHGVLLNSHLWRNQLAALSDIRRCIALDLLAHGDTEIVPDQNVSVTANAEMLTQFLDALKVDQVDLVGNDSGEAFVRFLRLSIRGGFAASHSRTVTPTTIGHPRHSNRFWQWRRTADYTGRLRRCCRTRAFTAHRTLWVLPMRILRD